MATTASGQKVEEPANQVSRVGGPGAASLPDADAIPFPRARQAKTKGVKKQDAFQKLASRLAIQITISIQPNKEDQ